MRHFSDWVYHATLYTVSKKRYHMMMPSSLVMKYFVMFFFCLDKIDFLFFFKYNTAKTTAICSVNNCKNWLFNAVKILCYLFEPSEWSDNSSFGSANSMSLGRGYLFGQPMEEGENVQRNLFDSYCLCISVWILIILLSNIIFKNKYCISERKLRGIFQTFY